MFLFQVLPYRSVGLSPASSTQRTRRYNERSAAGPGPCSGKKYTGNGYACAILVNNAGSATPKSCPPIECSLCYAGPLLERPCQRYLSHEHAPLKMTLKRKMFRELNEYLTKGRLSSHGSCYYWIFGIDPARWNLELRIDTTQKLLVTSIDTSKEDFFRNMEGSWILPRYCHGCYLV